MNAEPTHNDLTAFIGGGNMASAIIGGLRKSGTPGAQILVVEPDDAQRRRLERDHGVRTQPAADAALAGCATVVWAVKPQSFRDAALPCALHVHEALHLSVMAGIRSDTIARATGATRIVRAMPNTPALIGMGISGLYAREAVGPDERERVEKLLKPTGATLWVAREAELDAVTALSGSGPAYVFFFVEAMMAAAEQMGLTAEQGKELALATFSGAAELARRSKETPATLRERVTSKGGTTYAALTVLNAADVQRHFIEALRAAQHRAQELGVEFGA